MASVGRFLLADPVVVANCLIAFSLSECVPLTLHLYCRLDLKLTVIKADVTLEVFEGGN